LSERGQPVQMQTPYVPVHQKGGADLHHDPAKIGEGGRLARHLRTFPASGLHKESATTIVAPPRCLTCAFGSAPRRRTASSHEPRRNRHLRLDLRWLARPLLPARRGEEELACLVRPAISHGRNQWLVLSHAVARGGAGLARPDAERILVRLEGIEVHHSLETVDGKVRKLDRPDGNATQGAIA